MKRRLIKGSQAAKDFMAKIRAKKKKVSGPKKVIKKKIVTKKIKPKTKPKTTSLHKDTKSHNVKISVMSGTHDINLVDYRIDKYIDMQNHLLSLKKDRLKALKDLKKLKGVDRKFKRIDIDYLGNEIVKTTNNIKSIKKLYKSL